MEKYLIIANWKMNPATPNEARRLFESLIKGMGEIKGIKMVLCPPFVWLANLETRIYSGFRKNKTSFGLQLGAQNCHWEAGGAWTGEISPLMLKSLGCEYVLLGHSERRQNFNETDEIVSQKLKAALKAGIRPILCVGEKTEEKELLKEVLERQLNAALKEISEPSLQNLVIAYEPVWAIGTGNFCSVDDALTACLTLKKFLIKSFGKNQAEKIKIIYGGSVDGKNALSYVKEAEMDGLLVGGASLNASEFIRIVKSISYRRDL